MQIDEALHTKYATLSKFLDERAYRLCLACDAIAFGRGGISRVARASGVSRSTIYQGIRDLQSEPNRPSHYPALPNSRIRRSGGGRKPSAETEETLLPDLDALLDPVTRGDTMSPL